MTEGFIHISKPIHLKKDKFITINQKNNTVVCVLKGRLISIDKKKIYLKGKAYGLEDILSVKKSEIHLVAVEDSEIVEIINNLQSFDFIGNKSFSNFFEEAANIINGIGVLEKNEKEIN